MKRQIYLIFSCDEWKMNDSMRLISCTTSKTKLKRIVRDKICNGDFDYCCGHRFNGQKAYHFSKDFDVLTREQINDKLVFAYIDYCYDGEEI